MELFSIIFSSAALAVAIYVKMTTPDPSKSPPEDKWVRDGSVPEDKRGDYPPYLVIVERAAGIGAYFPEKKDWVCHFPGLGKRTITNVDAWQKFPEYEKI